MKRAHAGTGVGRQIFSRKVFKGGVYRMTMSRQELDHLVALLGGWPDHFTDRELVHGESLLAYLRRERVMDEVVFGLVVRYATHRAAFDRLSADLAKELAEKPLSDEAGKGGGYLSGKEQQRAFHENKLAALECELLGTPYQRVKAGLAAQTSFLSQLEPVQKAATEGDAGTVAKVVTPFKPLTKRGKAG